MKVDGLRTVSVGSYTYTITPEDLKMEQQAFEAGEGVSPCKLINLPLLWYLALYLYRCCYSCRSESLSGDFMGVCQVCGP